MEEVPISWEKVAEEVPIISRYVYEKRLQARRRPRRVKAERQSLTKREEEGKAGY